MKVYKRKIQLVAGSTFSLSLPKEWVLENGLSPQQEINLLEDENGILTFSPEKIKKVFNSEMNINIEESVNTLEEILYSLYYHGFETINLFSHKEISLATKKRLRKVLLDLSGTEIVYEDKFKITVKSMFDQPNVNIFQILYRISLLIDASIENILNNLDLVEVEINEAEVDRLYNLSVRVITSSISNRSLLESSGILDLRIIPPLFLLSKRLENISDNLKILANVLFTEKINSFILKDLLSFLKKELNKSILYLLGDRKKDFIKSSLEEAKFKDLASKIKNREIGTLTEELIRYLNNIQEEISSIRVYYKFIKN